MSAPTQSAFLDSLRHSQWLPPMELAAHQARLLERLCRHARAETRFYRERLGPLFDGDGGFCFERWSLLPILTRADIAEDPGRLHAAAVPPQTQGYAATFTSGTTGRPLSLRKSGLVNVAGIALGGRMVETHGLDPSATMGWLRPDEVGDAAPPEGAHHQGWCFLAPHADRYDLTSAASAAEAAHWLLHRRPRYLMAYPTLARALADELLRMGQSVTLEAVITTGETAGEDFAALMRARFGARHIDTYGLREIGLIAESCPEAGGLHINAETVLVEVIAEDGTAAAPGALGRVVATPLYNYATPLLRYDTGDLAVQGGANCPCGRGLPRLGAVVGRSRQLFTFPDGSRKVPTHINRAAAHLAYLDYQLVQTALDRIEFRYVPDPASDRRDETGALAWLKSILHPEVTVVLVPLEAIDRPANGKLQDCISLVSAA